MLYHRSKQVEMLHYEGNECFCIIETWQVLQEKSKFVYNGSTIKKDNDEVSDEVKTLNNSVGSKMMKLMGWAGGGLGKFEQGRLEPVA